MSSFRSSRVFRTSLKARERIAFSFWLTSCSDQKNDCRSCTHSKYETVTPPALARMSGTRKMPRSRKIASARGLHATRRAADFERLACDRRGHRVPEVHRKGVHDPRHGLAVGVDVGGRDVAIAADQD